MAGNVRQPTKAILMQSGYQAYSSWCSFPVRCLAFYSLHQCFSTFV